MYRCQLIVVAGALALTVGCAQNKNNKQMAANWKPQWETATTDTTATTQPSGGTFETAARANPTTAPSAAPGASAGAAANPLAGAWQLAIPRRHLRQATITATDATHVTIEAGKTLSGEYVVQDSFLLMITRDERLRPLAWMINSNDSLTLVRAPELGPGSSAFTGVTLLRAPDDAATEADLQELPAP